MDEFRRREVFSGETRVRPGSKTRKGVHRQHRQASCKSLVASAGTDAACETGAGESAHTSAAHEDVKTASGYAMARDQAMGRLGLVWRRLKQFYSEVLLLGVDCFRKNRPENVDVPLLRPDGMLDAKLIRVTDLRGNICVHPEADETFPRLKSQQRGVLQQLFGLKDPLIQEALADPANLGYIKNVLGLTELVVPGEDSRNKQLREIQALLGSGPIVVSTEKVASDEGRVEKSEPRAGARDDNCGSGNGAAPALHGQPFVTVG